MVKPGTPAEHALKAASFVDAARLLLGHGLPERATAEAYYAAFHVAQALLATAGLGAETHAGVHTLLARHFVKDGPLPASTARMLSHLMADRLLADYGVDRQVDAAGGASAVASAAELIRAMLPVLAERAPGTGNAVAALGAAVEALERAQPPAA
ncbi:MAG: HEPN domain-containing protein [Acetobacteraceae bacterium]|nr:HEPN domain-containing protein [Acetobacteraceae bacterium]